MAGARAVVGCVARATCVHFINGFSLLGDVADRVRRLVISSLRPGDRLHGVGFALMFGGILGNLYERVIFGYVTAFISVHWQQWHFPIPNVAVCRGPLRGGIVSV